MATIKFCFYCKTLLNFDGAVITIGSIEIPNKQDISWSVRSEVAISSAKRETAVRGSNYNYG